MNFLQRKGSLLNKSLRDLIWSEKKETNTPIQAAALLFGGEETVIKEDNILQCQLVPPTLSIINASSQNVTIYSKKKNGKLVMKFQIQPHEEKEILNGISFISPSQMRISLFGEPRPMWVAKQGEKIMSFTPTAKDDSSDFEDIKINRWYISD
tara:strand:+ start:151 stop:609 length:459 start_codon:yes stop_codon:yes gene_type:complete